MNTKNSQLNRLLSLFLMVFVAAGAAFFLASCGGDEIETETEPGVDPVVVIDSVYSIDSLPVYYSTAGNAKPALVFIHCWSCDRTYWQNQMEVFSKMYQVVAVDLAGHGQSGLGRENWTIQSYGADVANVVNKLGLDQVILIGHSMGGPVAVEAARRLEDKVLGIIGVDTFQNIDSMPSAEQVERMVGPFEKNFEKTTVNFVSQMFPPTTDTAIVTRIATDMASAAPEVAISSFRNMMTYDEAAAIEELDVPFRLINTDMWPVDMEALRERVPSVQIRLMDNYGHFIMLENPEEFNGLLDWAVEDILAIPKS